MGAGAGHAWVDDVASLEGLRSFGDRGSLGEVGVLGLLWDRRLILALPLRLGALGSAAPQLLVPTSSGCPCGLNQLEMMSDMALGGPPAGCAARQEAKAEAVIEMSVTTSGFFVWGRVFQKT